MSKKWWKRWDEQTVVKNRIKEALNEELTRDNLISKVVQSDPEFPGVWTSDDTNIAIDDLNALIEDWLVFEDANGIIRVTESESPEALVQATGQTDYPGALLFLFDKGVYHPDMDRFGLTENEDESPSSFAPPMNTMPESSKVTKVSGAQGEDLTYQEVPEGATKISSAVGMAVDAAFEDETHEFTIQEVQEQIPQIDSSAMAVEMGDWITTNVEQFIDNRETVFRMYLNVKSDGGMPVSSLFQRLYLSVPDVDDAKGISVEIIDSLYDALDAKLEEAKELLNADADFLAYLFKRMSFFYELTGFVVQDGKVLQAMTQAMQGKVQINELVFDPISLTTTVSQGVGKHEDGKIREGDEKVIIKQGVEPAGFGIEVEISLSPKNATPLAMY